MIALLLAAVLASAPDVPARENELELAFAAGAGSRWSFGAFAAFDTRWHLWGGRKVSGGLELGLVAGYQVEPIPLFQAPLFAPSELSGSNHRVQVLLTAGHGLRLWRFTVGTHLFLGWTQLSASGRLVNATHGIDEQVSGSNSELSFGAVLHARLKLTGLLSLSGRVFLPVPNFASGVNSTAIGSLGLAFHL